MEVEIRQLRAVVAVAEERSFTAAGRRLHLSQQTVSALVRRFETNLGATLFHRTTRSVAPTEVCEELLPDVRAALGLIEDALASADHEGFVLVPHATSVPDLEAVEEDPAVDRLYLDEMRTLLGEVTGADRVVMLGGGKKRYGESATTKLAPLKNAKPARYVHADVTDDSGPEQAAGVAGLVPGLALEDFGRWALFNIWRSITPPPQDFPLAVCDARTLAADDVVPVVAVTEVRGFGALEFETSGYLHNPRHRWCWFRDMAPDEVLVFKTHDGDPDRAHRVAHTAFTDPTCPPGTPTRASVEIRALALFR